MATWLSEHQPRRFDQLLIPEPTRIQVERASLQANPPHLMLSGPSGSGKTATWKLIARQVLGPSFESTTHVLQARDLARTAGAMQKFEEFLRPEGSSSRDTLAGRMSLDAFDANISAGVASSEPPAGKESSEVHGKDRAPVSRIIVIEDADYLGLARQSYLRRMMEQTSGSARFIFTAKTPSRVIEALRSRVQQIRLPSVPRKLIDGRISEILELENKQAARGVTGDIAHISAGNLRKAIFLCELMAKRDLLDDRRNLQKMVVATSMNEVQRMIEEALRGKVHDWRWEKQGNRNARVLKGAMGVLDELMSNHNLEAEDVVEHVHHLLVAGRLNLNEEILSDLLLSLSKCDVALRSSMIGRIQLEAFLLEVAQIGKAKLTA